MPITKLHWPAEPDERFAPDAFQYRIGQRILLTSNLVPGEQFDEGILVDAEVMDDGKAVILTIESPTTMTSVEQAI